VLLVLLVRSHETCWQWRHCVYPCNAALSTVTIWITQLVVCGPAANWNSLQQPFETYLHHHHPVSPFISKRNYLARRLALFIVAPFVIALFAIRMGEHKLPVSYLHLLTIVYCVESLHCHDRLRCIIEKTYNCQISFQ